MSKLPSRLKHAIHADPSTCVLWVGSGLSRTGVRSYGRGFPDWHQLMVRMIDRLGENGCSNSILASANEALGRHNYPRVASIFCRHSTVSEFAGLFREEFDPDDITRSTLHETILDTRFRGIFTTNFDRVFEAQSNPPRTVIRYPECLHDPLAFREHGFFAKIHGCVSRPYPADLVLTTKSFSALRINEQYLTILRTYFAAHPVITVGFSLNDPAFRAAIDGLQSVFGANMPPIFALSYNPSGNKPKWLVPTNVDIIPFHDSAELKYLFRELRDMSARRNPPSVVRISRKPAGPILSNDLKQNARKSFREWRQDAHTGKSWSKLFGRYEVTNKTWRHLTRVQTPPAAIAHRLFLLPLARDIVENATEAHRVRRIGPHRELLALEGVYKSKYEADVVVQVIVERWRPRKEVLRPVGTRRGREVVARSFLYADQFRIRILSFHEKTSRAGWERRWDPLSAED